MRLLGNVVWLVFGGFLGSLAWSLAGLLLCITVVGIPFGVQCFKIAGFVLMPFGREVVLGGFGVGGFLMNVLWILFFGWELALGHLAAAAVLGVTVVGIPFALQHLKLAQLALMPFGARFL